MQIWVNAKNTSLRFGKANIGLVPASSLAADLNVLVSVGIHSNFKSWTIPGWGISVGRGMHWFCCWEWKCQFWWLGEGSSPAATAGWEATYGSAFVSSMVLKKKTLTSHLCLGCSFHWNRQPDGKCWSNCPSLWPVLLILCSLLLPSGPCSIIGAHVRACCVPGIIDCVYWATRFALSVSESAKSGANTMAYQAQYLWSELVWCIVRVGWSAVSHTQALCLSLYKVLSSLSFCGFFSLIRKFCHPPALSDYVSRARCGTISTGKFLSLVGNSVAVHVHCLNVPIVLWLVWTSTRMGRCLLTLFTSASLRWFFVFRLLHRCLWLKLLLSFSHPQLLWSLLLQPLLKLLIRNLKQ